MPLWTHLTALVLVPLVGVGLLMTVVVRARTTEAASAARAEAAVRAVAQLGAARSGVEHEIMPVLSLAVIADPSTATALGLGSVFGRAQLDQTQASAHQTRAATDQALAGVPAGAVGAGAARQAASDLRTLRSAAEAGALDLVDIYKTYLRISDELMTAQRQATVAANSEEAPVQTLRAVRNVQVVAQLAQTASRQMPLFLGFQLTRFSTLPQFSEFSKSFLVSKEGAPMDLRSAWESAWHDYTDTVRQMEDLSEGSLSTAWGKVKGSGPMTAVDTVLSRYAEGTPDAQLSVLQMVMLMSQNAERDALLTGLVDTAVTDAQGLAAADRQRADERRTTTLELGIGLLFASVLGALMLGRRVARSLGLLAGQATQISEGSLVEVRVAGPREVQTVSAALGSAVAGLRRIQAQAQAVARGDLDNALLNESLPGALGEVVHASVKEIVHSVRQREELQFALAHQATHDPLTQLPNRAQALTLVTSALHRGNRSGEMTGLLFMDLDGFKAVNDGHGHAAGDEVLAEVACRLRAVVRPGDVVCRLGGDEFVILVEPVKSEHDLLDLAGRLIATVSEPIVVAGTSVRIGASVGVAVSRDGGTDADVLFAEADTAAYRAKGQGRGRAEIFDENLRLQLHARAELEAAITHGLAAGEMELHYQPVVELASDRIVGYEALVRWNRPGHGMVPPDAFIPAAEGSSLICDLDRWVLHEATRQLQEWRADRGAHAGATEPTVAVNISGRHLADRRVVMDVADALAASGLPPELLIVEVTETVLVSDPLAMDHLAALRDMGVGIAIDDFGTGYTSIGQLGTMPVDTLKIDRSFVASTEPGHRELVALIIRAAHTFGLTVVAEGVEEPAQLARLKAQACDQAQGYLMYRPMVASDAGALLRPLSESGATA